MRPINFSLVVVWAINSDQQISFFLQLWIFENATQTYLGGRMFSGYAETAAFFVDSVPVKSVCFYHNWKFQCKPSRVELCSVFGMHRIRMSFDIASVLFVRNYVLSFSRPLQFIQEVETFFKVSIISESICGGVTKSKSGRKDIKSKTNHDLSKKLDI